MIGINVFLSFWHSFLNCKITLSFLSVQEKKLEIQPEGLSATLAKGRERDTAKEGYVQLLPGVHPCDGFFVSMFRKIK